MGNNKRKGGDRCFKRDFKKQRGNKWDPNKESKHSKRDGFTPFEKENEAFDAYYKVTAAARSLS